MHDILHDPLHDAGNFAQVLAYWAEHSPDHPAFRFLEGGEGDGRVMTYGALDGAARRLAAALRAEAAPGDRALLLYAPGLAFVEAFAACVYAGVVAVPVYPPDPRQAARTLPRLLAIAEAADVRAVLTSAQIEGLLKPLVHQAPAFAGRAWLATDTIAATEGDTLAPALDASSDALALLQFTSGSTGTPRGVMVTHGNLLHNERCIRRGFGHDEHQCVGVGWLPTYHDMGLIGKVLQTAYLGATTTLMSPLDFLQRPERWLKAISRWGATTSGGPNFAYALCTRRIEDAAMEGVDLSSWRVAFCGAEPVHHATLQAFARRFARWGFRSEALFPCYGLAESTLMVSGGWLGSSAKVTWARSEALERDLLEVAAPDTLGSAALVTCGSAAEGLEVAVVQPDTRVSAGPGRVGEIWVQGGSVAGGYWRDPQATEATFCATRADAPGTWLRTGDLGALDHDGQLIVTGRLKDMIIVHGRNLYPQDIEETVHGAHPGVYAGSTAAVALREGEHERLGLVVGLRRGHTPDAVADAVRQAVAVSHGLAVDRLALVDPKQVPRTSSGKIQRAECARMLADGSLTSVDLDLDAMPTDDLDDHPIYAPPGEYLRKLETRNTRYRFDIETDVLWDQLGDPGLYFTRDVLQRSGVDLDTLGALPGAVDTLQWALAVAICEEFVALEQRIVVFLREERAAGRLPPSRSADLFDEEEVKHVALFRRYADGLKAQRPDVAAALDRHLQHSFQTAWWYEDRVEDYPSPEVYHFVSWLHFVYFEEYSIYLCKELQAEPQVQPAWLTAHIAHMQEERQHVLTDSAHLFGVKLSDAERSAWSRWFLEHSAKDASGLAGLEGAWTFLVEQHPELSSTAQPHALLDNMALRKRAFGRLISQPKAFPLTLRHATGFDDFMADVNPVALAPEADAAQQPAPSAQAASGDAASDTSADGLRRVLARAIGAALRMPADQVNLHQPLIYFGLDSIHAVQISADLEALLGRTLPPTLLFEHPTIHALAEALAAPVAADAAASGDAGDVAPDRGDDLLLDDAIFASAPATKPAQEVFVTGATGFLCAFVLAELLRTTPHTARCLVRAESLEAGAARLKANLERYGLWEDAFEARIVPVVGDLEQTRFGLSEAAFEALAQDIDVIFHGGAWVDFIQPYERLRGANVGGTREILRLAFQGGRVPLNLISTIGIFDTRDQTGQRCVGEDDTPNAAAGFRNGYGESKWVAERLVQQARERGLPVRVFRPGVVSGDTQTGAWQPDLVATLLKTYAKHGAAILPAADGSLDAAPVDYVARAMLHIADDPSTLGGVFHLTNPNPTPWRAIYAAMTRLGYPVRALPYQAWLDDLRDNPEAAELRPFLPYFKARAQAWQLRQAPMDCARTIDALKGSDIACPTLDDALLRVYLRYLLADPANADASSQGAQPEEAPHVR